MVATLYIFFEGVKLAAFLSWLRVSGISSFGDLLHFLIRKKLSNADEKM